MFTPEDQAVLARTWPRPAYVVAARGSHGVAVAGDEAVCEGLPRIAKVLKDSFNVSFSFND